VANTRSGDSASVVRRSSRAAGSDDAWRHGNVGRLLSNALRRFEERVIELLLEAGYDEVPQSHINATRHLDVEGTRLTDMAQRAAMTKQSMSELVDQLERDGLVTRRPDPTDRRARLVCFTPAGLVWLDHFGVAVKMAEREMARTIGADALRATKQSLRRYDASVG
jgi:DNA-binding MarR family transcriptional regulator